MVVRAEHHHHLPGLHNLPFRHQLHANASVHMLHPVSGRKCIPYTEMLNVSSSLDTGNWLMVVEDKATTVRSQSFLNPTSSNLSATNEK